MVEWDRIVDVVVVGTGGAALVAATLARDGGAEAAARAIPAAPAPKPRR